LATAVKDAPELGLQEGYYFCVTYFIHHFVFEGLEGKFYEQIKLVDN
jgi:hypothetical protein